MLRALTVRAIFYAGLAAIAIAAISMIPLLNALIVEGRELTAIEDVVIDLFIGFVVFVGLAVLVLRHQSLRRDQYQQIINEEKERPGFTNSGERPYNSQ